MADFPGGESFWQRDSDSLGNSDDRTDISAVSWEAAIQKHIEGELCATSSEVRGTLHFPILILYNNVLLVFYILQCALG